MSLPPSTPQPAAAIFGKDGSGPSRKPGSGAPVPERKRRTRRGIWHAIRMAGMGVTGLLGGALLFQVYVRVNHPFRLGDEEARKVVAMRQRLSRQEARNEQLESRLRYLRSLEGVETLARRAGYHRPGEVVFLLDRDAITATESATTTKTPEASPSPR